MTAATHTWQAVRCLQQLAAQPGGASALSVARAEDLELQTVSELLETLAVSGLIVAVESGCYRLARSPGEIRVDSIGRALGRRADQTGPARLTIADLLEWEAQLFADASIARAA